MSGTSALRVDRAICYDRHPTWTMWAPVWAMCLCRAKRTGAVRGHAAVQAANFSNPPAGQARMLVTSEVEHMVVVVH